jgi:hypothetical protein
MSRWSDPRVFDEAVALGAALAIAGWIENQVEEVLLGNRTAEEAFLRIERCGELFEEARRDIRRHLRRRGGG